MQMIPVGNAPRQYRMAEFVEPSQLVVAVAHLEASQVDDLR